MRSNVTIFAFLALAAVAVAGAALLPAVGEAQPGAQAAPAAGRGAAAPAAAPQAGRGAAAPAAPQAARGAAPAAQAIPRTAEGKPDFSGIWQVLDNSLDGNIEPHHASFGVRAGQGAIVDPPDGRIPYRPDALERRQANYKNRVNDPVAHCWKPGVPRITYIPFPFQVVQSSKVIMLTYEFVHNSRVIYLNDSKHLEGIDFFNGDSRAKWEGDTLVVDVTNLTDDPKRPTWFDSSGNYHSDVLHVVERYTFNGPDMITYRATMNDTKVFSRPWTIEVLLYRHKEKNFRIMEYECQMFKEQLVKEGKGNVLRIVEGN